jgi:subtilisin family serine protease
MATPIASGAAAILWSHFPQCTNKQIRYALAYTARDINGGGCDQNLGYGLVQVKAAYDFLARNSCRGASWGQKEGTGRCDVIDARPPR